MPTARELLEQADALMRRNRGRLPEPDIPELTEEIDAAEPPRPAAHSPQGMPGSPLAADDDVPELTDAVEVEGLAALEPLPDEGEESRWLDMDAGEASITGPAPDSIAVVPPSAPRERPPAALDEAPRAAREEAPPAAHEVAPPGQPSSASDERKLAPTAVAALAAAAAGTLAGGAAPRAGPSDPAFDAMLGLPLAEPRFEREPAASPEAEEATAAEPAPIAAAAIEIVEIPEVGAPPEIVEIPASPVQPVAEIPAAATTPAAPAAPSWDSVAEDIRMQVLQRIDIFTDTGLSAELATRLQPVVDRASADLVATINREVGQLLRTYVAEAIEREIEKWRQGNP